MLFRDESLAERTILVRNIIHPRCFRSSSFAVYVRSIRPVKVFCISIHLCAYDFFIDMSARLQDARCNERMQKRPELDAECSRLRMEREEVYRSTRWPFYNPPTIFLYLFFISLPLSLPPSLSPSLPPSLSPSLPPSLSLLTC